MGEMPTDPRELLRWLMARDDRDMAWVSRQIGRNPAFVHQYLTRNTPRELGERDRERLAALFRVHPDLFRQPDGDGVSFQVRNPDSHSESGEREEPEDRMTMLERRITAHDELFADVLARLRRLEAKAFDKQEEPASRPSRRG